MKLIEIFNTVDKIQWVTKKEDEWVGKFEIDDVEYRVFIEKIVFHYNGTVDKQWNIRFEANNYVDLNNLGNEFKVFSIVVDAIKEFLKQEKTNFLNFTAKEYSRIKLYKRMIKKLAPTIGFKLSKSSNANNGFFRLIREES